jgi:hypothetical protein
VFTKVVGDAVMKAGGFAEAAQSFGTPKPAPPASALPPDLPTHGLEARVADTSPKIRANAAAARGSGFN